jgi:hypothetical protein
MKWSSPEYIHHDKDLSWYFLIAMIVIIIVIISLITDLVSQLVFLSIDFFILICQLWTIVCTII